MGSAVVQSLWILFPPRGAPFDVGVRQGLPLPPLHTRAHARTHTRTRTTLCRQGSGGSKVTDSCSRPLARSLAHRLSGRILARALSSLPARAGGTPGRGAPLSFRCLPLKERHEGEGRPGGGGGGGERPGGRPGGRARAHSEGRSKRRAASGRRAPPCRPMLCSMANSGCLLLSNSGSMLPHSVPCPPAFLYLQQVSGPPPGPGPQPGARAPRAAAHAPHLAASAPPPPPLVAPAALPASWRRGWGRGNCAPARRPSAGAPRARAARGGGAGVWGVARNFSEGAGGGGGRSLRGSPRGGGGGSRRPGHFGELRARPRVTRGGEPGILPGSVGKAGGRGEAAAGAPSSAAAQTARRASGEAGEAGHPLG